MLTVFTILFLGFNLATSCPPNSLQIQITRRRTISQEDQEFVEYLDKYDKKYCDDDEFLRRKSVFFDNLKYIDELNAISNRNDGEPDEYGVNYYTDKTYEELAKTYTGFADYNEDEDELQRMAVPMGEVPETLDYTQSGCVTRVKDQYNCNGCYAFSAIGAIESQYCLKYGHLYTLSEQQAIDCGPGNCKTGGQMLQVFRDLASVGGAVQEYNYPFRNNKFQCFFNPNLIVVRVAGGTDLQIRGEEDLKRALQLHGPLTFGIVSPPEWFHNTGQIYSGAGCERQGGPIPNARHAMLLVGYGQDNYGRKYWKVKNSWGATKWGDKGYGYILRGPNVCGIYNNVGIPFIP